MIVPFSLWLISLLTGDVSSEGIAPISPNEFVSEGDSITLSCSYKGSATTDTLLWYRQYPKRSRPQFLYLVNEAKFEQPADPPIPGISTKINEEKNQIDLEISTTALTDSALYYCALMPTVSYGNILANTIISHGSEKQVLEGDSVTLTCNYSADPGSTFQWYRKYSRSAPEFLLYIYESGMKSEDIPPHLTPRINKDTKQIDLEISSAAVTDSALYYCALKPTVTGNPTTLYKNLKQRNLFYI
ncbi:T cell receptor alpha chain MC.7.G5-like [Myxocyprinus asiaticus]|uniref:T cell receptor alpha chain MC.7.G5-like n=1 Tax=Myxocyprinus asiaticus TaxID=70543 RepID=UPI002223A3B8|nr:T cell receptor alpha chain MC.7.G5-like [Myxocyprinus asiaticus]